MKLAIKQTGWCSDFYWPAKHKDFYYSEQGQNTGNDYQVNKLCGNLFSLYNRVKWYLCISQKPGSVYSQACPSSNLGSKQVICWYLYQCQMATHMTTLKAGSQWSLNSYESSFVQLCDGTIMFIICDSADWSRRIFLSTTLTLILQHSTLDRCVSSIIWMARGWCKYGLGTKIYSSKHNWFYSAASFTIAENSKKEQIKG